MRALVVTHPFRAWLLALTLCTTTATAQEADPSRLPAAIVAQITQKAQALDVRHLQDLPAASRRGVLESFVRSSFAQALNLPGFDENLLNPSEQAQAETVVRTVLGEAPDPPTPPSPRPTPRRRPPTRRVAPSAVVVPPPPPAPTWVVVPAPTPAPIYLVPVAPPAWILVPQASHPWHIGRHHHHRGGG